MGSGGDGNIYAGNNVEVSGTNNIYIGNDSGNGNTNNHSGNIGIGKGTLTNLIEDGVYSVLDNTVIGNMSGSSIVNGKYNSLLGANTGKLISSGWGNTIHGYSSGSKIETGSYNICLGYKAGENLGPSSSNTICLGMGTGPSINDEDGNDLNFRLFIDCMSSGDAPNFKGTKSLIYGDQSGFNRNQLTFNADVTIDAGDRGGDDGYLNIKSSKILLNGNLGTTGQVMKVNGDGTKLEWVTQDFASEAFVNGLSFGLSAKTTCKAATTANLSADSTTNQELVFPGLPFSTPLPDGFNSIIDLFSLDGVYLYEGDRVLIKNNVNNEEKWNGIYIIGPLTGDTATLTRATDFNTNGDIGIGSYIDIDEGTTQINKRFVFT